MDAEEWKISLKDKIKCELDCALQNVMLNVGTDNATIVIMNILKKFVLNSLLYNFLIFL